MRKTIIFLLIAIITVSLLFYKSDGGSGGVADKMALESVRGDVVELQGKGVYYRNKYGVYPVKDEDVYENTDGEVIKSLQVFERYFDKAPEGAKDYIKANIKLANSEELKSKGITYELANKNSRYFYDITTGMVLSADLIDKDVDYRDEVLKGTSEYKVIGLLKLVDSVNATKVMENVNGSYKSGSTMYFYGSGTMVLAKRNELNTEVSEVKHNLGSDVKEILYIQPGSMKAVIVTNTDKVEIVEIKID